MSIRLLLNRLRESRIQIEVKDGKLKINAPKGALTPTLVEELKNGKQEILDFLQRNVKNQVDYASVEPVEEKEYYALSSAQRRMYFLQRLDLKSTVYNISRILSLPERSDVKRLETTFKRLIHRHESLRTSFQMVEDKLVQVVHREVGFNIRSYDGIDDFVRAFDLSRAPLLRVGVIDSKSDGRLLVIDMHHIISDGISDGILRREFMALERGEHLPPLRIQYKDYAEWQINAMSGHAYRQQEAYWLNLFSGEIPVLDVPTDYPRPAFQSFDGSRVFFDIPPKETALLMEMARKNELTLYMVLLSFLAVLLSKLSRREDIVIGTPVAGRGHADLDNIIGMFVNTLAIRIYPSGEKTFDRFLHDVGRQVLEAFENQNCQFEDLVDKVVKNRDTARSPLFDIMFAFQSFEDVRQNVPGENTAGNGAENTRGNAGKNAGENRDIFRVSRFDMSWYGVYHGDNITFSVEYSTRLFKEDTIRRFVKYFKKIISGAVNDTGKKISDIEIISEEEKKQILLDFNNTDTPYPGDRAYHRLFEEQAEKDPHRIALGGTSLIRSPGYESVQMTYRQLNRNADYLARTLLARGIEPEGVVGILVERSIEMVAAMLAVLKAGGAFMPIDPEYPPERKKYMLEDSRVEFLVLSPETRGAFEAESGETAGRSPAPALQCICLDGGVVPAPGDTPAASPSPPSVGGENIAYIIYTSGSTGNPKGTLIEHHSLVNLCRWHNECYSITPRDRATQFAGIGFDAVIWEIFPYLIAGSSIHIVDKEKRLELRLLNNYYEKDHITVSFLPTQICEEFTTTPNRSLRILLTGGDKLKTYTKRDYQLVNNYGPTENTVVSTYFPVTGDYPNIPIGKPVNNTKLYILDNLQRLQPVGVPGELCVSGVGLARGYLNNPAMTAERFFNMSYRSNKSYKTYSTLYKTGDLAKWLPDGNVQFLGRIDAQVKIRGRRIELGEIEHQLLTHECIKEVVVTTKEQNDNKFLCAYIVPVEGFEIAGLKRYLSHKLPDYMVPSYFIAMETLPLTSSGKVDRKVLPAPEIKANETYSPPINEKEEKLCELWSEVLGIEKEKISVEDDFFEIGGNSINLINLVGKISKELKIEIPISHIYHYPTIREIARALISKDFHEQPVVLLNRPRPRKIFCFPNQAGFGFSYGSLAVQLHDYSVYAFDFIEEEDRLSRYIDLVKEIQPDGPYVFFGHSAAGRLSFELTKAFENRGFEVSDIIFADCFLFEKGVRDFEGETARLRLRVQEFLELWNAEFLKEKVMKKAESHMVYLSTAPKLEVINANVHLILSEEVRARDDIDLRCWENLTAKTFRTYHGWGTHHSMLSGGDLKKNITFMRDILSRVPFGEE